MLCTNRRVTTGDIIELGETVEAISVDVQRGGRFLYVVSSGETDEYVYLEQRFSDEDEIQIPDSSTIIDVSDGSGVANPVCRYLVPVEAYGGET